MSLKHLLAIGAAATIACGHAPPAQNPEAPKTTQAKVDLGPAPEASDARLAWAMAGAHRSEKNRARDVYRHPKETLAFFGVTKDSHVVELWPGTGWYTEILAPFLRDSGKLVDTNFDPKIVQGEPKEHAIAFDAKLAGAPGIYGKVEVVRIKPPGDIVLGPDGSADVVLTFRNFHNWIMGGFAKNVVAAAYKVLKPGGVFGVVEHRADPGTDAKTSAQTGYVPEQAIIDMAQAAGFKLAGKSDVNANPKDDHKHEGGVWALPPSLRNGDKDRAKYTAIGESDRMTLKFVK
jgi:predicted methyltransferase